MYYLVPRSPCSYEVAIHGRRFVLEARTDDDFFSLRTVLPYRSARVLVLRQDLRH